MPKDGGLPVQPDLYAGMEAVVPPSPTVLEAQEIWNTYAEKNKWKKCVVLDKARKATIARAVGDYGGILGWRKAIETVERSRFVMGKVPPREGTKFKQFQAHIDWFCQAKTIRQVFEGFYEDDGGQNGVGVSRPVSQGIDWRGTLERYRKGRFWHKDTMGNRPEDPGPHKAPAEMIEAWRKKHGVTGVPNVAVHETREEKLSATIRSYRNIGRWADANRLEEQLAALQGRPPELIAAPDARDPDVVPSKPKPPPYRPGPVRSEAEITRQMAARENATDVDYSWATDRDGEYEDA